MKRHLRRALPFVLAVVLLAAAGIAAYIAREASRLESAISRDDATFRVEPQREGLWETESRVDDLLGVEDDLAYRRASRLYELLRLRGRDPYDFQARGFRADAQLALASAHRAGLIRSTESKAENIDAIITLEEALGDPRNGPTLIQRSLSGFRRAIALDPTNDEAMYNLELVLRLLAPNAARLQIRYGVNTAGRGVAGAAPIRRGHGY